MLDFDQHFNQLALVLLYKDIDIDKKAKITRYQRYNKYQYIILYVKLYLLNRKNIENN